MSLFREKIRTLVKLAFASIVFCALQLSYDYWQHTTAYYQKQEKKREELNERFKTFRNNLETLLTIAVERIAKYPQTPQRIQNILSSLQSLTEGIDHPSLQRVVFKTHQQIVTRFGVQPLSTSDPPTQTELSPDLFLKDAETLVVKKPSVLKKGDPPIGWLELEIAKEDLVAYLKPAPFFEIQLTSLKKKVLEKEQGRNALKPFWIKNIPPKSLYTFICHEWFHYCYFFIYLFVSFLLLVLGLYRINRHSHNERSSYFANIEAQIRILSKESEVLRSENSALQNELKSQTLSFSTYKTLISDRTSYFKGEAQKIQMALNTLWQSYKSLQLQLPEKECLNLFLISLKSSQAITDLIPSPYEKADSWVNVRDCIDKVVSLFSYKIFKGNILLEVHCPSDLALKMNPSFVTLILINLVGKAFYRVPYQGEVRVTISEENNEAFCIQVEDNGFYLEGVVEKLVLQSFEDFIEETILRKAYQEYGFLFNTQKTDQGNTQTCLTLPKKPPLTDWSNVVPLFS